MAMYEDNVDCNNTVCGTVYADSSGDITGQFHCCSVISCSSSMCIIYVYGKVAEKEDI